MGVLAERADIGVVTGDLSISDREFEAFRKFIFQAAGISLSPAKKMLVSGRLAKRVRHHRLPSFQSYFEFISSGQQPGELQTAVDLLTTNETYFFREPQHFEFLKTTIVAAHPPGQTFRIWSAACSSGEEPYTLAMVLAATFNTTPWELVASDISSKVLKQAQAGQYPMERAERIPPAYLKAYCLRGIGACQGTFLIDPTLRQRMQFLSVNLNEPLPKLGQFDVIFLRNVMIYFNPETKKQVVSRLLEVLKPGGYFFVSHSETLHGVTDALTVVQASIYQKR